MGKLRSDGQRSLQTERQKAVDEAWKFEVELVRRGKGTRQWTADEQKELLATGKVNGYYGHHMQSVKTNPENAGNKDNIQFLNYEEHINGAHQGSTKNSTNGYYDPQTGQMHEFKDGKLVPIIPMELEQQAFESVEERENTYRQGMVDRYSANLDKKLANYQKSLEQRDDLTDEEKSAKYKERTLKYEADKREYQVSMFSKTIEETNFGGKSQETDLTTGQGNLDNANIGTESSENGVGTSESGTESTEISDGIESYDSGSNFETASGGEASDDGIGY